MDSNEKALKRQMDSNEKAWKRQIDGNEKAGGIAGILIMLIIGAYYRIYYHPI